MFASIKTLHTLKNKGKKVGKLKFKKEVNSIPLRALKYTYDIDFKTYRIRIQGLKTWLKVNGLEKIPSNIEIANAVLIRKNNEYYVNITTFTNEKLKTNKNELVVVDILPIVAVC